MKRILALVDDKGSRFHRLIVPLSLLPKDKYSVTYLPKDYVTEEVVKDYDLLMFTWIQATKCSLLSVWREKYGFKIVQDLDDYWKLPHTHAQKKSVELSFHQLESQMILADHIICSTEFLLEKAKYYNPSVSLRKNFIPLHEEIFTPEIRLVSPGEKIAIGICGSSSHFPDWLSIKGQIDKMKSDTEIQDKCIFVVAGYSNAGDKRNGWDDMVDLLTYKRDGKTVHPMVLASQPLNKYMHLYGKIDILLAPLLVSDYNRAKSELKLFEGACKSSVVISNELYEEKGYTDYLKVDREMSYYKWVKRLLDREHLNKLKVEFQKNLLQICASYEQEYSIEKLLEKI